MREIFRGFLITFVLLFASSGWSAALDSFCHVRNAAGAEIQGHDIDDVLPIASVSKIVTSWWAIAAKGPEYRFLTQVHIHDNGDGTHNIHMEGSRDPFFGKQTLHYFISEMNKIGITRIKKMTFDENFKFFWNVTSGKIATGDYTLDAPKPRMVLNLLKNRDLRIGYQQTVRSLNQIGIKLVDRPQFKVERVEFLSNKDFDAKAFEHVRHIRSSPLLQLLKEMNRNSNNHAANQIFEHLGGAAAFAEFVEKKLDLTSDEIQFVNGSGDRLNIEGKGYYNRASCRSILTIMQNLTVLLHTYQLDLTAILPVTGADINSTTNENYRNKNTDHTLVGKTGTVAAAITLAGMISTNSGEVFFLYNMRTNGTTTDWRKARAKIKIKVTDLIIKNYKGGAKIDYEVSRFVPFESLEEQESQMPPERDSLAQN